jgi:hypothetical protein
MCIKPLHPTTNDFGASNCKELDNFFRHQPRRGAILVVA